VIHNICISLVKYVFFHVWVSAVQILYLNFCLKQFKCISMIAGGHNRFSWIYSNFSYFFCYSLATVNVIHLQVLEIYVLCSEYVKIFQVWCLCGPINARDYAASVNWIWGSTPPYSCSWCTTHVINMDHFFMILKQISRVLCSVH
jgi:hypothetical protein